MANGLERYKEKRDFKRTPEPPPRIKAKEGPLTFVVQKHSARALHYDLRLELDGALKSWAVPKGPSYDPTDKHLAAMVEDHPLEYATFEGSIPEGEYGAGEVIVWDSGTYSPDEGGKLLFSDPAAAEAEMRQGLEKGKLSFTLRGHKLKGSWTLVKMQKTKNDWLLMKHRDEYASARDILKEDKSVISGRTIEDVRAGRQPEKTAAKPPNLREVPGAKKAPLPSTIAPMLASLAKGPFSLPGWIFEPKLDGYRVIARIKDAQVRLLSRNSKDVSRQFAAIVPDLSAQPAAELVLDGEVIAMDEKGQQCFQCLQNYMRAVRGAGSKSDVQYPLIYYVFDVLYMDGYDLTGVPLSSRKEILKGLLLSTPQVRPVDVFEKEGETVYEAAVKNGLEGVIAKKADSKYEPGKRSPDWLKIKATLSDDFVIGGYSVKEGRAQTFSSLLLGTYNDKGKLIFAGHVGSGFDEKSLNEMKSRLDALRTDRRPFAEEPPLNAPTVWVKPEMVAEVKFREWTQEGNLRHPVFLRLREDKAPEEIRRSETIDVADPVKATDDPPPRAKADKSDSVLEQLQNHENDFILDVDGSKIKLSNVDKVLWPATAGHPDFTKRDFLTYLAKVAPFILPHLKDRPLTLSRYPDGIHGEHFWQKHWGHPVPDFVTRVDISEEKGTKSEYLICDNRASLLWLGQVANLELHSWFSRTSAAPDMPGKHDTDYILDYPDFIIFDLDPYIYSGKEASGEEPELNKAGFTRACEVAVWVKELLDELDFRAFVKTSGKTGIHIYVPIVRRFNYKAVRAAAEIVGKYLVQRHPDDVTTEWAQEKRKGKIFVDYGQNVRGKTLASVYSPRPAPNAAVSTPLKWEELGKVYPTDFTIKTLPDRLKKTGDLWADILNAKGDLDKLTGTK